VARTAVELHGCCARVSLAAALLSKHIDGVARAGSAGTKSGSRARSLVLLTMLAPVVENRTVEGSARARRRSELANGKSPTDRSATPAAGLPVAPRSAICQLPASARRGPADSSESACSEQTPPCVSIFILDTPSPNPKINRENNNITRETLPFAPVSLPETVRPRCTYFIESDDNAVNGKVYAVGKTNISTVYCNKMRVPVASSRQIDISDFLRFGSSVRSGPSAPSHPPPDRRSLAPS
jgi:hypothetical protein